MRSSPPPVGDHEVPQNGGLRSALHQEMQGFPDGSVCSLANTIGGVLWNNILANLQYLNDLLGFQCGWNDILSSHTKDI